MTKINQATYIHVWDIRCCVVIKAIIPVKPWHDSSSIALQTEFTFGKYVRTYVFEGLNFSGEKGTVSDGHSILQQSCNTWEQHSGTAGYVRSCALISSPPIYWSRSTDETGRIGNDRDYWSPPVTIMYSAEKCKLLLKYINTMVEDSYQVSSSWK